MQFGVDEAGRGPVLGSMFAACVRGDPDDLPEGVADSKRLPAERRERLAAAIRERFDVAVAEVPVERIDGDEDMNTLTVAAQAEALSGVCAADDGGVVDACDTSESRFADRLRDRLEVAVDIRAEHGADDAYPMVAAASIVAKVARDAHVATLADEHGAVGSGYPGDATTREFLREFVAEHDRLPDCARESWATAQDVLARAEQSALGDF